MRLVDLTLKIPGTSREETVARLEERPIGHGSARYTGRVYHFAHDSMVGTYLDLPGHIRETDDGLDAANYPLEKLYRLEATALHMDRGDGSGGVSSDELRHACPNLVAGQALILNALGQRRFDEVAFRSVWLETSAVRWICDTGIRLLLSDIYESPALHGVFPELFRAGISTVCHPVNLDRLTAPCGRVTVLPVRIFGVTQLPCRVVAEWE